MSSTEEPQQQSGDQPTTVNSSEKYKLLEKYKTLSRLYDYSLVSTTVNSSFDLYNYAKSYSLLRMPMELSEATVSLVSKPILDVCDPLISRADDYTADKIDKLESTAVRTKELVISTVTPYKESAINTLTKTVSKVDSTLETFIEFGEEKISGTPLQELIAKSATQIESIADNVVDTILPPASDEPTSDPSEMYNLEKRFPVIYKIRTRVNTESVKGIPSNTYQGITKYTTVKPISYLVDKIHAAADKISSMNLSDVKDEVSKKTIDQIYQYLDTTAASVGNFSLWVHRFDPNEILISITELTNMIKESKNQILNMDDQKQKVQKFKDDCAKILSKTGQILQQQIDSGKAKVEEWKKSDLTIVKTTIVMVEQAVHNILLVIPNILLYPAELIEYANNSYKENTNNSSSSTPNNESTNSTPNNESSPTQES
ncbi:hypothetical protein PPL_12002 [Heterostelium album PN500]|uniref:Perilipin n=1 Tax=Heterostelium pallidum (strain ATCC 26659 / Pp 5 / PN500) TaxID=670386 RepID=D3BV30_HETP5|nr:hypothetical protein PPL_12002 [Heterostelium album PN500]EFA74968.1 hypothetical protein PPL_12002 [Heterostelium album PN500]|eukprot:XP_020427102.1 hypothetical protein PPL_12002 [Heterostelium album PN500]